MRAGLIMSDYFQRTLFVHTPGTRLVLEGDALRALRDDAEPRRLPLRAVDSIVVASGVDVSTPLLVRCAEDGRLVVFISRFGKARAVVEGAQSGRGVLRKLQYSAHFDAGRRLEFARAVVAGKLGHLGRGLKQWARDSDAGLATELRTAAGRVADLSEQCSEAVSRSELMGIEGAASRAYFDGLGQAMRTVEWAGRNRRPTKDPANAALSFLYGICRVSVHGAVTAAGLDPFCGFLHGDTDGQPSLVLDLLEEFRPSVDRVVVTLFNRRQLSAAHFDRDALGTYSLSAEGREAVMNAWHDFRYTKVRLRGGVAGVPNAAVPLIQGHAMANALRHGVTYEPHQLAVK